METMIFETFSESIITGITIHNQLLEPNVYTCKQMVLIHSVRNAGNNSRQPALQQLLTVMFQNNVWKEVWSKGHNIGM